MKLYRNAIILIIIVALLGGAYYFINKNKAAQDEQDGGEEDVAVLTDFESDDIETITFKNSGNTFVLAVKDDKWVLTSPDDIIADPSVLNSMAENARSISADKLVEENAADVSVYGLNNPVTVEIKLKDGTTSVLEVGDETPVGNGYYAKLSGESNVYTIRTYAAQKLLVDRNGMKEKKLYEFPAETLNKISMDREGANLFKAKLVEDGGWEMYDPITGSANASALLPMTEALATAEVSEFIEEKPTDLSKYGLDAPRYVFEITSSEAGTYKLLLGKEKTRDTDIYAMLEGRDEVFTLSTENFFFLDKPIDELFQVFAYIVNIGEVSEIDLIMNGKTTHMTLDVYKDEEGKNDKSKDKFTVNGVDASAEDEDGNQPFRAFYQALVGVILDEIDLDGKPEGEPEITIEYKLESGTMRIDYVPKDENYYYVLRNGEYANIVVKKNKGEFGVRGIKEAYEKMMDFLAQ